VTTKSRATDEPNDEAPAESTTVVDEDQGDGPAVETAEPLNPTGQPNEELPNAEPDPSVEAVKEVGGDRAQAVFDEANEKGYFGEAPDQDRDAYTLQGQARRNE
jgi:hypothetical protein